MTLQSLRCPECGANITIEEGRKMCFCTYCGAQISIDNGIREHIYRNIDEAKIKEADVKGQIESERIRAEAKVTKTKEAHKILKLLLVIIIIVALYKIIPEILSFFSDWSEDSIAGVLCIILLGVIIVCVTKDN